MPNQSTMEFEDDETLLIYPPEDIKQRIDVTASHVATLGPKKGPTFEKLALKKQPNLTFLKGDDPYRPYYELRLKKFVEGDKGELAVPKPEGLVEAEQKEAKQELGKAKKKDRLLMIKSFAENPDVSGLSDKVSGLGISGGASGDGAAADDGGFGNITAVKPDEDEYSLTALPNLAPLDFDLLKVTAQFVARNGASFLIQLSQREERNPQFDFLKATHYLFPTFKKLTDTYSQILLGGKDARAKLERIEDDKTYEMKKALERYMYEEQERKARGEKDEAVEKDRQRMLEIDWHDFVVVETIEFTAEDERIALQEPVDFTKVKIADTLDPEEQVEIIPVAPAIEEEEEGMEMEDGKNEDYRKVYIEDEGMEMEDGSDQEMDLDDEDKEALAKEKQAALAATAVADDKPPTLTDAGKAGAAKEKKDRAMSSDLLAKEKEAKDAEKELKPKESLKAPKLDDKIAMPEEDDFEDMKIVSDYDRKKRREGEIQYDKCPITGQMVPANEMTEHLRIVLMDPKYRTQKEKALEKARQNNRFFENVEVNLADFVRMRPDLFGTVEEEIEVAAEVGDESNARQAGADSGATYSVMAKAGELDGLKGAPVNLLGITNPLGVGLMPPGMGNLPPHLAAAAMHNAAQNAAQAGQKRSLNDESDYPSAKRAKHNPTPHNRAALLARLIPEQDFIDRHGEEAQATVVVECDPDLELGQDELELTLSPETTIDEIIEHIAESFEVEDNSTLRLTNAMFGELERQHSLAFFNIFTGSGSLRLEKI